jgi:glycosyltransferase involved in cell wall biosynthesis
MQTNKKRILFVTEANWLPTGYSVYTKQVLSRLHATGKFEIGELACYAKPSDTDKMNATPWRVFPNTPNLDDAAGREKYHSSPSLMFGEYTFNSVLLDFKPDFVMDIRDFWMLEFEQRSPFRNNYKWVIMPTVDAKPQNPAWIDCFANADAHFAYSEFGRDVLIEQAGDSINFQDVASPCAADCYKPMDKAKIRDKYGLETDINIVGTVMRNQKRKMFPDLMDGFRRYLDETGDTKTFLYLHTYFPDIGWDIPELIHEHGLSSKVLMTYKCKDCGAIFPSFYQDNHRFCRSCGKPKAQLVGMDNKIEDHELAEIYNLFDVYVQYANSEGFGMPQVEAVQCGVPLMATYYSAMESVVDNLGAIPLNPLTLYKEVETGCYRAIPDNENFKEELKSFLAKPQHERALIAATQRSKSLKRYSWDKTAAMWEKYFTETEILDRSKTWDCPIDKRRPIPETYPKGQPIAETVSYFINEVLGQPELDRTYLWKRMCRDLNYGNHVESHGQGIYFSEDSDPDTNRAKKIFNYDVAFEYMVKMRKQINEWEGYRIESLISK